MIAVMLLSLAYSLDRFLAELCLVRTRSDAELRAEVLALRPSTPRPGAQAGETTLAAGRPPPTGCPQSAFPEVHLVSSAAQSRDPAAWHRDLVRRK